MQKKNPRASGSKHGYTVSLLDQLGTFLSDSFQKLFHLLKPDPIIWNGAECELRAISRSHCPSGPTVTAC